MTFKLAYSFLLILFFHSCYSFAQTDEKSSVKMNVGILPNKAKAIVIGISTYQNIKSLHFADKDAIEFADFLLNNSGWKLQKEDLILLTNENAKQGDILMSLQWLLETTEEGEDVIFYFSGHGDVESVGGDKQGFLLAHDSPKNNYPIGGTLPVSIMDSVFSALIAKNIHVTMIIDACRSGQLAGGMSGKSQTMEALSNRWKNEIRILSSQPDQLSYENEKWGGGRGVFSYYLVKGLSGFADMNGDMKIFLSELEQYIGSNIAAQTDYTQQPILDGPNKFSKVISRKDEEFMLRYKEDRTEGELTMVLLTSKASGEVVESECKTLYYQLTSELENGLSRNKFNSVRSNFRTIQTCVKEDIPSQLRYLYMRNLINEINRIVMSTLSGEKLVDNTDFIYGMNLIDELLSINKDKTLVGREHFENLRVFLKTLTFIYENDTYEYSDLQFILQSETISLDEGDLSDWMASFNSWDLHKPKKISLNVDSTPNTLTWEQKYVKVLHVFENFQYALQGKTKLDVVYNHDSINLLSITDPNTKVKKIENYKKFEKEYINGLILELNSAIEQEPNAAYLIFAKARLMSNKLHNTKEALKLYDSVMVKSPKWLTPRYLMGTYYENVHKYEKALEYYESILELDSIYQDFECVNCFYMSMLNTYFKAKKYTELDLHLNEWEQKLGSDSSIWLWYLGLARTSFDEKFKKGQEFWLEKLWNKTDYSLDKQFDLLLVEMNINKTKYKEKEVLKFVREMVYQVKSDSLTNYFLDTTVTDRNNNDACNECNTPIGLRFFPDEKKILIPSGKPISTVVLEELSPIIGSLHERKWGLINNDLLLESFYIQTIIHESDLLNYYDWLKILSFLSDRYNLSSKWNFYKNEDLELEDIFQETFTNSKVNNRIYSEYYADLIQDHLSDVSDLMEGRDIRTKKAFKDLEANVYSFEDQNTLKEIHKLIDKMLSQNSEE